MRSLVVALLALALVGCAGLNGNPRVPCLDRMRLDAHKTWGDRDSGDFRSSTDDGRGYQPTVTRGAFDGGDYDEFRFGGSLEFAFGTPPEKCPAYRPVAP